MSSMSTYSALYKATSTLGGNTQRISTSRPPSMYGGAGGSNVRVSYAGGSRTGFELSQALGGGDHDWYDFNILDNEKFTMQNLNTRLASYLEKVRSLEKFNSELEQQILEWHEKNTPESRDYNKYEMAIHELHSKISAAGHKKSKIIVQLDNTNLAAEDFRVKLDSEHGIRQTIENDIARVKKVLDDITLYRSDVEMNIEKLSNELIIMKKTHEKEMADLRAEIRNSSVNVEVDAAPQEDMFEILLKIREKYEGMIRDHSKEVEAWYQKKYDELSKQVVQNTTLIQSSRSEVNEHKKTLQSLEIECQSSLQQKQVLEATIENIKQDYGQKLSRQQAEIHMKEEELSRIRSDIQNQQQEFNTLLNIKDRLEMEIAEYRRLLEGDVQTTQTVQVVKRDPVVTRKVHTVIEEVVDGKVISRTEDVDVEVVKS